MASLASARRASREQLWRRVCGRTQFACIGLLAIVGSACAASDSAADRAALDAGTDQGSSVHPIFKPTKDPQAFGAIPWPDDLYLNAAGRIEVAELPGGLDRSEYGSAMRDALRDLDGFGVLSPVFFFFDGEIDPASLPRDAAASLEDDASVFLVDADTGSPAAFRRIPVVFDWNARERRLAMRPIPGHALTPARRYAAVVTRRLRDATGRAIEASASFAAVRDADQVLTDPPLLEARAAYTPVFETLDRGALSRKDIAALAVFRVQSVRGDLDDARTTARAIEASPVITTLLMGAQLESMLGAPQTPGPGLDEPGGVAHEHLFAIASGTLISPSFTSALAKTHGAFERDEAGQLRVKRTDDVPFTLFLPHAPSADVEVPVVIFQHARARDRSDAIVVANRLAASGIAVVAIDAPFHGLRTKGTDERNRFTGELMPDGFGDAPSDFVGAMEMQGGLLPLHPFYLRDAFRQGVIDLMSLVRVLERGQLSSSLQEHASFADYGTLATQHFGFVGNELGGQMGVVLASQEPSVDALVLAFTGAGIVESWAHSPSDSTLFSQLVAAVGRDPDADFEQDPPHFWPELAVVQTLADRAEPIAFAGMLRRLRTDVLLLMAEHDEVTPNVATEALGFSLGVTLATGEPLHVPGLPVQGAASGASIFSNFVIEDDPSTRVLYTYTEAAHDSLIHRQGVQRFARPVQRPFRALDEVRTFENPLEVVLEQVDAYFSSYYECVRAAPSAPTATCDAVVRVP